MHGRLRPRGRLRLWFFTHVFFWKWLAMAQERPRFSANLFDETNTSYRSDVCDWQSKLWRNEIIMPNAFKGLELNVGITYYNTNLERIIFI